MIGWLFALSGAAAGAAQAGLLGRTIHRRLHPPVGLLVRVGLVAVALVVAARADHLLSGALGWLAGFLFVALVVHRSFR